MSPNHNNHTNGVIAEHQLVIQNEVGLHARPAAAFVKLATRFESEIQIRKGDEEVNGKSIMGLLTLQLSKGTPFILRVEGPDAAKAAKALKHLVDNKFDID